MSAFLCVDCGGRLDVHRLSMGQQQCADCVHDPAPALRLAVEGAYQRLRALDKGNPCRGAAVCLARRSCPYDPSCDH